jgi:cytochrome c nitrite reductase small subunit
MTSPRGRPPWKSREGPSSRPALFAISVGVLFGLGSYTFRYAEGLAYFSNRPEACANCHIMRDHLDSWQKSSHHTRATCNDCHTPHALIPKLITKAENGWNHSVAFTLQTFKDPLQITKRNRQRVEHNCRGCHENLVSEIAGGGHGGARDISCIHCHEDVGHGPRR